MNSLPEIVSANYAATLRLARRERTIRQLTRPFFSASTLAPAGFRRVKLAGGVSALRLV